ncbi:MAG: restriction endonuclease subunit S [Betaproteobacteria bacterium]|nr:restriction endonuclease subunit S [Betaproteobacteria bacterium]
MGEVCDVIGGGTPSKDNANFYTGDIPWATVRDMRSDVITQTEFKITKAAVASSATNVIPCGNVVIATRVGLGKVCLLKQDTAINQDLRGIIPKDCKILYVRYLFWWLKSIADLIIAEGTGATVQGVKLPFIKSLKIPLPHLPEQQRIVAILDEAFSGIATVRANTERNLQNARALFESYLHEVFSRRGEGWVEKNFGDLATFRNGINFTKASKGEPIKILGVKDFQSNFWMPQNELDTVTPDGIVPDTDTLNENDLVFVRSNGNPELIGRCVLVGKLSERTTHSGFTIRARLHSKDVSSRFICHFLKSGNARKEMIEGGSGINIKSLNQGTLSHLSVSFPSLNEQTVIADRLDCLKTETQHLASLYQRKLNALDELKQSLLHQAFSGEL